MGVRIKFDDVRLQLGFLFGREVHSRLGLSLLDEGGDRGFIQRVGSAELPNSVVLLLNACVALDSLVELLHLAVASVKEVLLLLQLFGDLVELVLELDFLLLRSVNVSQHENKSDDVELLLEDSSLEEQSLLVDGEKTLFDLGLDFKDIVLDIFERELPSPALLLFEFFLFLEEFLELLLLLIGHFLLGLAHPLFSLQVLLVLTLVFLQD